jgi:secondary thiamine-phosphate synthase enzyme
MHTLNVSTSESMELIDITQRVRQVVGESGVADGIVVVYVPHTTAGIVINEHADPNVARDIQSDLGRLVPWDQPYYRHAEGNSPSHVRASIVGSSETILVQGGDMVLGTWQGIFLCEFDGPRRRRVYVKILEG